MTQLRSKLQQFNSTIYYAELLLKVERYIIMKILVSVIVNVTFSHWVEIWLLFFRSPLKCSSVYGLSLIFLFIHSTCRICVIVLTAWRRKEWHVKNSFSWILVSWLKIASQPIGDKSWQESNGFPWVEFSLFRYLKFPLMNYINLILPWTFFLCLACFAKGCMTWKSGLMWKQTDQNPQKLLGEQAVLSQKIRWAVLPR